MDLGLAGKKALVTGATKGLGRAIAETLLAEGASVAICARDAEGVEVAVAELSSQGEVCGSAVDAGDLESLSGWINNFNIDLMSLVGGVGAAQEALADGGGSLISIGTTATAEHFASGSGSYSAFKAAVTNWTLGQAQVLGAQGIRCNVVSPGPIMVEGGDWDGIKQGMPEFYEATQKTHPQGDLGLPEDVANAVAFLSGDAAKHINGVNLTVDGGFLKRVNF